MSSHDQAAKEAQAEMEAKKKAAIEYAQGAKRRASEFVAGHKGAVDGYLENVEFNDLVHDLRRLYICNGFLLFMVALGGLVDMLEFDLPKFIMGVMTMLCSGLILGFELNWSMFNIGPLLHEYFLFLGTFAGRAVFIVFVGSFVWTFGTLGITVSCINLLTAIANVYAMLTHKAFKEDPSLLTGEFTKTYEDISFPHLEEGSGGRPSQEKR